ncbi:putative clathrin assembly protein [Quercus suber]|uniref:Clathrin assembly protein n=1 Tax=Quercus suber TaxID=58331 RepID=A0AAW0JXI1_QUESU
MMRRFRQVFTALREHSHVSYAKIATVTGFCDVELIIIKATAPDDLPLPEKYIHELLKIFSISPFRESVPDDCPFRSEILWTRTNGLITLYPCHFRDDSSFASDDYTAFIRSYAQLLDEVLNCFVLDKNAKDYQDDEVVPETLPEKMKEVGRMLQILPELQSLIDRVMDCRPTGLAARSFIVRSAMKHIIRDSFICYRMFRREIVAVLDNLFHMPYRSFISAFGVYKKAAVQANQLSEFYDWCKSMGLCGSYEHPFVDQIPRIQIQALETFLNGMWQMTDSSSSPSPATSRSSSDEWTITEDGDRQVALVPKEDIVGKWETFEEDNALVRNCEKEMEPLITFDDGENVGGEALLEASSNQSCASKAQSFLFLNHTEHYYGYGNEYEYDHCKRNGQGDDKNVSWKMQIHNPNALNPFCQPYNVPSYHGLFPYNNGIGRLETTLKSSVEA